MYYRSNAQGKTKGKERGDLDVVWTYPPGGQTHLKNEICPDPASYTVQ